jgi:hypothetical protein
MDTSVDFLPASWEAREVCFEPTSGNGELGGINIGIGKDRETRSPKLIDDKIIHKGNDRHGVIGTISRVFHGKFDGQPAVLIVFQFVFRSAGGMSRFRNATIDITFSSPDASPLEVANWAPRKIYGIPSKESVSMSWYGELSASIPLGSVQPGGNAGWNSRSSYIKEHRLSVVGNRWQDKESSTWNKAYWDIKEKGKMAYGIPDILNVAAIVQCNSPFLAEVKVSASGLWAWLWPNDNPVLFPLEKNKGKPLQVQDFKELTEEAWRTLIPWEGEWKVNRAKMQSLKTVTHLNTDIARMLLPEFFSSDGMFKVLGNMRHNMLEYIDSA